MAEAATKTPTWGTTPETDYEWLELSDFTAGCYDYSAIAADHPVVPSPKYAADAKETFSCIGLPNGGLGPLPGFDAVYTWTPAHGTNPAFTYVTGLLVHNEIVGSVQEAIVMVEWDDGTNHHFDAESFDINTLTFTDITNTTTPSGGLNEFPFGSPYPQMTRAAATAPTTTPGGPVCVFPVASFAYTATGTAGQLFMYPNPATRTSYVPLKLITDGAPQSLTGMVLVHQSRIIVLANAGYDYPLGGAGAWVVNEQINFTDPPNSVTYPPQTDPGQQTVAVAEEPYGFGCGGSISAGELFLVKRRGGGVVITGDIFDPTITFLPGVQPTGQGYGNADSGTAGLFYCSINEGAWLWNGSNTSQKISNQLDDDFFTVPGAAIYLSWYVKNIGDKVYFSNNWLLDLRTNSWWRYYPDATQGGVTFFWIQGVNGPSIYCAPLTFTSASPVFMYRFTESVPAQQFQWQSLPIRLTVNRLVQARRVLLRASSNAGNGGATVSVQLFNGTTMIASATTTGGGPSAIGSTPTMISMPIGNVNAPGGVSPQTEDMTVRIVANGNGAAAPNIHSVSIGWEKKQQPETVGVAS